MLVSLALVVIVVGGISTSRTSRNRSASLAGRTARPDRLRAATVRFLPTLAHRLGWDAPTPHRTGQPANPQELIRSLCNLLHAGISPQHAWQALGVLTTDNGVPVLQSLGTRITAVGGSAQYTQSLRATCIVAATLGTSLASALTSVGHSLDNLQYSESERTIALSGPRTSAQILRALPLLGCASAYLLGAQPAQWFASSPLGITTLGAGLLCLALGHAWTKKLIARAQETPQ